MPYEMARSAKSKITGIEMFHKSLEEGHAGDQVLATE